MTVTIVIVSYNSGVLLERCLQCLSNQTVLADQLVVIDNASDDPASCSMLSELTNVTLIRNDENVGYGAAINLAVRSTEPTEFVVCLNPDAFPEKEWLENMVNAATKHPDYGSFASLMLREEDCTVIDGAGDELHFTGIPWRRYHRRPLWDDLKTEPVFSACAGAAMYRTSAFNAVNGFDESYFMYVEDIDLGFRLQLAGLPCLFIREAVVHHIGSAITGEDSDFSIFYGHRNLVYCYFKNMPGVLLAVTLPFHLLANLVTLATLAVRGKGAAMVKAKLDAIKRLPAAIRARGSVARQVGPPHIWKLLNKSITR